MSPWASGVSVLPPSLVKSCLYCLRYTSTIPTEPFFNYVSRRQVLSLITKRVLIHIAQSLSHVWLFCNTTEQAGEEVPDKAPPERQKQSGRVGGMEPGSRLLCPWSFSGKNTGVGCRFLLQGIFPTQRSILSLLHLLHWQADALPWVTPGKPLYSHYKVRANSFIPLWLYNPSKQKQMITMDWENWQNSDMYGPSGPKSKNTVPVCVWDSLPSEAPGKPPADSLYIVPAGNALMMDKISKQWGRSETMTMTATIRTATETTTSAQPHWWQPARHCKEHARNPQANSMRKAPSVVPML